MIFAWTKIRLAQTQVCPALRNFEAIRPSAAASRSASSNTMKGALPPSSIETFLIVPAACRSNSRPISVDPVKLILRTVGLDVSSPPTSAGREVGTTLNTPLGIPASPASSAMTKADRGVSSAGFATIVHPAASAAAAFRASMALGKFQGVIAAQTPTGWRITTIRLSAAGAGMTSP